MSTRLMLALWVLLAIGIAATQRSYESAGSPALQSMATPLATPIASTGVTRTVLVGTQPESAPGQTLQLVRYVIEPGTTLPAHTHPGTQIASIVSGELTYVVVTGSIAVERAAVDGTPGPPETLDAGERTLLRPGDAVIETAGNAHYGENLGIEPVVILASTLLESGQPAALTVPVASPVVD